MGDRPGALGFREETDVRKDPECRWIGWPGDKWKRGDRLRLREVRFLVQRHTARRQHAEFNPKAHTFPTTRAPV